MTNASPFKLLDAYEEKDKDIFFGRDEEIEALYTMAFQRKLTLVYGQSGTGKTSLIKSGLARKIAPSDWLNIYIRRGNNINTSLERKLRGFDEKTNVSQSSLKQRLLARRGIKSARGPKEKPVVSPQSMTQMLSAIYGYYLKPVYLLFDQFEELYIFGTPEEQHKFYHTIREILDQLPFCKIILIMREEYIAHLYAFEKVVPELFEKRLRIEPMSAVKATEVITGSAEKFEIQFGDDQIPIKIVDVVTGGKGRVQLPYLQIFLDKLYRIAARQNPSRIVFTEDLLNQLGDIKNVLEEFLVEQLNIFESKFINRDNGVRFLRVFVSVRGTKAPQSLEQIREMLPDLTRREIIDYLEFFEERRILRPVEDEKYELTHDSLAERILRENIRGLTMPEIPKPAKLSENPFIGFRSYDTTQAPYFYGRDREIRELFDKIVNEPDHNLTVLYGPLGVGKTSLVKAGLMPRVKAFYDVFYARISKAFIDRFTPALSENGKSSLLLKTIIQSRPDTEKPDLLILDQFEEFFIWLDHAQLENLYQDIKKLLNESRRRRILIVLREENFAALSDIEAIIPRFLDHRLRLNPIQKEAASTIVWKNCQLADIPLESKDIVDKILEAVMVENEIQLGFLQMYLNTLQEELTS